MKVFEGWILGVVVFILVCMGLKGNAQQEYVQLPNGAMALKRETLEAPKNIPSFLLIYRTYGVYQQRQQEDSGGFVQRWAYSSVLCQTIEEALKVLLDNQVEEQGFVGLWRLDGKSEVKLILSKVDHPAGKVEVEKPAWVEYQWKEKGGKD